MSRILRVLIVIGAAAVLFGPFAIGTVEFAKKENRQCLYCHTALGKPDLNDAGKYYKEKKTLEGYREKKPSP
ncbi:MAG: hypothetical protein HYU27_07780 [Acidobacteria bacterium]|nr:hypothetical protein [Acidobacteriota bacterium]